MSEEESSRTKKSRCDHGLPRETFWHNTVLVDAGQAVRDDVNDSLFGMRRVGQLHH